MGSNHFLGRYSKNSAEKKYLFFLLTVVQAVL